MLVLHPNEAEDIMEWKTNLKVEEPCYKKQTQSYTKQLQKPTSKSCLGGWKDRDRHLDNYNYMADSEIKSHENQRWKSNPKP